MPEATEIHKYHFTLTSETPVASKRQGSDQCQLPRWQRPDCKPNYWQSCPSWELKRSCQRGLSLPEKVYCISVVQREVQCQAAAQGNKPLFIWKRMLFVSDASLLESLLSIAVDVLLTGHFIMLLTPWGMIPEKCIINCFRGQAPGSAVTYCHCYWLRPISRFFQEHEHDRRRLRTVWLLLLHTDWHSWKGTELALGRKSNQRQHPVPIRMHHETEAAERALGSYSQLQGSRLPVYSAGCECYMSFTSFGGSFYSQIHLNYLKPLKGHLPNENTLDSVTVLQQIWDGIREFHELRGINESSWS